MVLKLVMNQVRLINSMIILLTGLENYKDIIHDLNEALETL